MESAAGLCYAHQAAKLAIQRGRRRLCSRGDESGRMGRQRPRLGAGEPQRKGRTSTPEEAGRGALAIGVHGHHDDVDVAR